MDGDGVCWDEGDLADSECFVVIPPCMSCDFLSDAIFELDLYISHKWCVIDMYDSADGSINESCFDG